MNSSVVHAYAKLHLYINKKNKTMKSQNNKMNAIRRTCFMSLFITIMTLLSSCSQNIFDVADRYKVVFWFNEETSRQLLDDGADSLTFYINYNNAVIKTSVDDVFWSTAPSCDDSTALSFTIDLLPKESNIYFTLKDQTGFEYYSSTFQLLPHNSCNAIEIGPITKFK